MIFVEMYGRLGNQFFRYAAARAIQKKYYPDEKIVINFTQINDIHKIDTSFYNVLEDYNVAPYDVYPKSGKVIFKESGLIQKIVGAFYYFEIKSIETVNMNAMIAVEKKWQPTLDKLGLYWYRRGGKELGYSKLKHKFISGNFENPLFFSEIREELLKEFTPKHPRIEKNQKLYDIIEFKESVCISIRRGDFESNETIKSLHSVCHKDYYLRAINEIKKHVKDPVFILFSDDIEWAKENIKTGAETYHEDGTDPVWEKLRMMSLCKHFIISNSTFSWWSQYLATNMNKVVISPSRWFNNDYKSPLIQENFIKIDV